VPVTRLRRDQACKGNVQVRRPKDQLLRRGLRNRLRQQGRRYAASSIQNVENLDGRLLRDWLIARVKIAAENQPAAAGPTPFFRALVVLQLPSLLGRRSRQRHLISPSPSPRCAV
jgi:hypothetical protein